MEGEFKYKVASSCKKSMRRGDQTAEVFVSMSISGDTINEYKTDIAQFEDPETRKILLRQNELNIKLTDEMMSKIEWKTEAKVFTNAPAPALTPKAQEPPQQQGFTTHTVSVEGYLDHEGFKRRDWPDGNPKWERQDTELKVSIYSKDGFWVMAFYDVDTREKAYYKPGENKVYDEIMQNIHRIESVGGK